MRTKQISRADLATAQKFDERRRRAAFLRITHKLPGGRARLGKARNVWDHVAQGTNPVADPATRAVELCSLAMGAAIATGNSAIIDATRAEIANYWDECKASALGETQLPGLPALDAALCALAKEHAEAIAAGVEAHTHPDETTIERAEREVRDSLRAGEVFLSAAARVRRSRFRSTLGAAS